MQRLQLPQCALAGSIDRQRQIRVQLAEKEVRAGAAIDQHGVLADPAQPRIARQRFFQYRGGIHVSPIAEVADDGMDAFGQLLQPVAHQLVIVASQRVARHVTRFGILQDIPGIGGAGRDVIHAHRDDALRAWLQFGRSRAAGAMTRHVFHVAVMAVIEPAFEMLFVLAQVGAADAGVGEAQLARPALDVMGEGGVVGCVANAGVGHPPIVKAAHAYNPRMPMHPYSRDLHTVEQLRQMERAALAALGITGQELMRRAASAALNSLRRHWPQVRHIGIHCGPGNNGGDGFLLGVLAREAGLQVELSALTGVSPGDAAVARQAWVSGGGRVHGVGGADALPDVELHVDALYGIGLHRAPEGEAAELIEQINRSGRPVLALDVPSGLDTDTGHCAGAAVCADVTVTFIAGKRGLHTGRAADHVGVLELATLGVPDSVYAGVIPDARLLMVETLPRRPRYANKGDNGHVLVIGGDHGMAGAARLAGEAALRCGAGLVSVATRAEHLFAINAGRPELMVHGIDGPQTLAPMLDRASVLALGPGLGQAAWGHALWLTALDANKPLVVDADGLNLLSREPRRFSAPTILTPHPGEAATIAWRVRNRGRT